jgi:hypothetical protein|tara:strand:+ start:457 stop:849 length:393 start_codon:yes stop_codon:yes gene_type:complete
MTRSGTRISRLPFVLALLLTGLAPAGATVQQDVVGDWHGTLETSNLGDLSVIFHVSQTDDGLAATMDIPAQGAFDIPLDRVVFDPPKIELEISSVGGRYGGYIGEVDGDTMTGTWSQGPESLPLTLERTD